MLSKRELLLDEKDCAGMLNMSIKEYRDSLKNIKAPSDENIDMNRVQYDNSILSFLGIKESQLKKYIKE